MELDWVEFQGDKGMPWWMLTVAISDTGIIFVPAAFAGDEQVVLFCTQIEDTPYAMSDDHVFVPSTWLAAKFPVARELCEMMEQWVEDMDTDEAPKQPTR
ncbi:hypothetical protein N7645_25810 [Pseudomonas juntendi]|uniref:hypothetical protein n=1 Tax=Pseudomonas TaxID=286 RepID=UPI0006D41786|nr:MULTISPECIES: hypothetical protein [Pseudomonas]MDG9890549.1 hypothetical protein [Pseudomonas juntendi]MDG9921632.1 hypothetical protein [Pseudomonas juntendi]MDH0509723.1 hypothetical protein [Pseudomonas juntendi]MDH1046829.1 hypothetical protein [Pseudomonas juntendi]